MGSILHTHQAHHGDFLYASSTLMDTMAVVNSLYVRARSHEHTSGRTCQGTPPGLAPRHAWSILLCRSRVATRDRMSVVNLMSVVGMIYIVPTMKVTQPIAATICDAQAMTHAYPYLTDSRSDRQCMANMRAANPAQCAAQVVHNIATMISPFHYVA